MLCVICIMSAALFYYDFVIIPRQNRELVEDLKSHFPEEFPPGGGSPTQKEEQAGRELEVPAVESAEGLPGKLRHQWKFVPPGRLYSGRIGKSDHLRSQHEQRGNVRESGSVLLL